MIKRTVLNPRFQTTILNYSYIRKKDIDQICQPYAGSTSKIDKIKMYTKMFSHIGKEGFKGAWADLALYRRLRDKPKNMYTSEDWNQLIRIYHDFFRLGPLFVIQVLPMSGPLFILYMYTYPGSIPSWFIIDKFHQDHQLKIRAVQQQAVKYFQSRNIKPQDINFDQMSLEEARKLAECLYGYHRDGTSGYRKLFGKDIAYIISQGFSKYLIKRKLKYKFNADLEHREIFKNMSLDQKIKWKYEQVVTKGILLKNYQDTLTAEQLRIRKELAAAEQNMQSEGNKAPEQKQK